MKEIKILESGYTKRLCPECGATGAHKDIIPRGIFESIFGTPDRYRCGKCGCLWEEIKKLNVGEI